MISRYQKHSVVDRLQSSKQRARKRGRFAPLSWRRILVAIEFSPVSRRLLDYASKLIAREPAHVILLHVLEPIHVTRDFGYGPVSWRRSNTSAVTQANARLRRLATRRLGSGGAWSVCVRIGSICEEIVKASQEMDVGLIIIGTGHTGAVMPVAAAGVASRVSSRLHCPVLVLRSPPPEVICVCSID